MLGFYVVSAIWGILFTLANVPLKTEPLSSDTNKIRTIIRMVASFIAAVGIFNLVQIFLF